MLCINHWRVPHYLDCTKTQSLKFEKIGERGQLCSLVHWFALKMPELHWPWAGLPTVNLLHCSSQKLCSWYTASDGAVMFSPFPHASASGMPNVSRVMILATIKTGKPSYLSGSRIHLFFNLDSSSLEPYWISVIQSNKVVKKLGRGVFLQAGWKHAYGFISTVSQKIWLKTNVRLHFCRERAFQLFFY